jgi:hypothetical protein
MESFQNTKLCDSNLSLVLPYYFIQKISFHTNFHTKKHISRNSGNCGDDNSGAFKIIHERGGGRSTKCLNFFQSQTVILISLEV